MFPRSWFLVVLVILLCSCFVAPWRRRRRRRAPPPPPVNCGVTAWSQWGACSEDCAIGTRTRYRTVHTPPAYGGASCPTLSDVGGCGAVNGGCEDSCHGDGTCSCISTQGYELQADGKSCADKNECLDGSAQCINSNCKNTDGSYVCECLSGYQPTSNPRQCEPKSCAPLTVPQCPADSYRDVFGATCTPATINCPDGYEYLESCVIKCRDNFNLAAIAQPSLGQKFAENFTTVDFNTPSDRTVCTVNPISGAVEWDWNPVTTPYYCRRINDPPLTITLSNTVIDEKQSFLSSVGTLTATDPQKNQVTFIIVNPEGNYYFLIQGNMLLVKTRLVWIPGRSNVYSVVVNATDNGSPPMSFETTLNITVANINDAPYDLELSNNEVPENVPVNHIVGNLTAIDDDIGQRRTSNFSWELLDSDNGFFSLDKNHILVAKSLDHESKNIHRIQVRCTDFGIPRESSPLVSMFISVRDSNDSPKYINLTNHRVVENSPVGTVIGDVIATDDDNDTLSFHLNGSDENVLRKFALQGSTACGPRLRDGKLMQTCSVALVVNGSLDYELDNEYVIWVAVTDPGGVTRKRFRIEVENVNERPTDILMTDNRVLENSFGGTVVGEFLVKDPDNKNNRVQTHSCALLNSLSGDEDSFYISQTDERNLLHVKPNKILDYETKRLYNISVSCNDGELDIAKLFLVEITDVNEPPTALFMSNVSVEESPSKSIYIATLSAKDPEGTNQTFIYTVRNAGSFRIGGTYKDKLFFVGPLDFESTPSISVHLRVIDNGGLFLEKIFRIMVQDVNDPPTDIILEANSVLSEDSYPSVFIGGIEMIDEDSDTRPSCQLIISDDRVQLNRLNLLVGATPTDYESLNSTKSLHILVKCSDQYNASVTRWISIPVKDVNEAPTDLVLSKLKVRENKNGTLVGIINITDPDVGQRHNCSLDPQDSPFYIDSSAYPPTLRTARPLDFENKTQEYINIRCEDIVQDHLQAQYSILRQFRIDVIDVNEQPQVLCDTLFHVSPSSSRGSAIGQMRGYDPDNEQYHKSKKQKPNGPFKIRKQLLSYRLEPENNSWPFDMTRNGIMYLEKQLNADENNGKIIFGVRVDDDGVVLERKVGSNEYQIRKDETKYSVHNCSIVIIANESDIDIHLSSNTIYENATYGTIVGRFSRQSLVENEQVTYHIIEEENGTQPFKIDGDILKLDMDKSLDYELLSNDKKLPITISSVASISGVFTKQFLIEILDVNEMPTAICLASSPKPDDCSVIGHIIIEDLDHPDVKCENNMTQPFDELSGKLTEYTCHIQQGVDTLSNRVVVDGHFYIKDSPPILYVNKTIFAQGDRPYNVSVVCRSTLRALHIFSATLNVPIKVPNETNCREAGLCASCPQPQFCLTNVQATGKCVGENYRINATVALPVSYFEQPGFISLFELYVGSLIEGKSEGKTLKHLTEEFNRSSRRSRREEPTTFYDDVYVEQFVYFAQGARTNVVFAVAEKPSYDLIPVSKACQLLNESEVTCVEKDSNTSAGKEGNSGTSGGKGGDSGTSGGKGGDSGTSGGKGGDSGTSGFPLWIIYIIAALIVVAFIVVLIVLRRRRRNKNVNSATVRFARDDDVVTVGSMYETPVDAKDQGSLSHSGTSDPVLVEKRKDIKVFHNPTYRSKTKGSDSETEENEPKRRTMNHYEMTDPAPIYETIDDDLYEKVHDERVKGQDREALGSTQTVGTNKANKTRKKSRNPVYDIGEDDDDLNPVFNLAVTSPSRKAKKDANFISSDHESNDSDDSLSNQIMSTFQAQKKPDHSYENVGIVNPLHKDEPQAGEPEEDDSKPSIEVKNKLYPLEHQDSFKTNPGDGEQFSSC